MWPLVAIVALLGVLLGIGIVTSPDLVILVVAVAMAGILGFVIGSDRARRLIERALEENE